METLSLVEKWLLKLKPKEKNNHSNPKLKHNYKHFDKRIINPKRYLKLIENTGYVSKHAFLPLIKFEKKKYKYKNMENGKRKLVKRDEKGNRKVREIMYASHLDTLIYVWYQCILEELYESKINNLNISESVLAYRKITKNDGGGKSNIDFADEVFNRIQDGTTALAFDISDFFTSLSHISLKDKWCELLQKTSLPDDHYNVFRSVTKYSHINITPQDIKKLLGVRTKGQYRHKKNYCDGVNNFGLNFRILKKQIRDLEVKNKKIYFESNKTDRGIPQGSPLSGMLANIYLIDIDKKLNVFLKAEQGVYRRYSDDIIVVCPSEKACDIEKGIMDEISALKDKYGNPYLKINPAKTSRIIFKTIEKKLTAFDLDDKKNQVNQKHLQYLGFEFNGKKRFIRSGSIARLYNRLNKAIHRTIKNSKKGGPLLSKKLFSKFSSRGKRNFFSYIKNSRKIIKNNSFNRQTKKVIRTIEKGLKKV